MGGRVSGEGERQPQEGRVARLLAIDPGSTSGWAYFQEGRLQQCGYWKKERMLSEFCIAPSASILVLVESQMIYPNGKAEIPDNDVVTLARLAGELAGRYSHPGSAREYVLPRVWKGTVPKEVVAKRVLAVLDEAERVLIYSTMSARAKKLDHNMLDAVGIGLWRLGRKYRSEAQ